MSQYFCTPLSPPPLTGVDTSGLMGQLRASGLPVTDVQTSGAFPGQVIVVCSTDLTANQSTQLNTTVAAWDPRPRVKRSLFAIYTDLTALTATQQTNVWNDLSSGSPAKYLLDAGADAAAIIVLDWVVRKAGATGAALTDAKLRAAAMYVQDNVTYLVNPVFDATINVPGDMVAP